MSSRDFCPNCNYETTELIICPKCRTPKSRKTEEQMCRTALFRTLKESGYSAKSDNDVEKAVDAVIDQAKKSIPESDWAKPFALFAASVCVMTEAARRNIKGATNGTSKV